MEQDLVVLLTIGTVGDVVPILNLAKRLVPNSQCTLITHQEHQVSQLHNDSWTLSMIASCFVLDTPREWSHDQRSVLHEQGWLRAALAGSKVGLSFVTAPPARVWNTAAELCSSEVHTGEVSREDCLEEHLQACTSALALPGAHPAQDGSRLLSGVASPASAPRRAHELP